MATYIKPNVLVYEEKISSAATGETSQRPWIVGPNAVIHDRENSELCEYANDVPEQGLVARLPDLKAGSVVDEKSVAVYADDALLQYAEIEAKTSPSDEDKAAYNLPVTPNVLTFRNVNLRENGNHERSSIFGSRDVEVGDKVLLSAYAASIPGVTQCANVEFETEIIEFLPDIEGGIVYPAVRKTNKNQPTLISVKQPATPVTGATGEYTGNTGKDTFVLTVTSVSNDEASYSVGDTAADTASSLSDDKYTFTLDTGCTVTLLAADVAADAAFVVTFDGPELISVTKNDATITSDATATYKGTCASEIYKLTVTKLDTTKNEAAYTVWSASGTDSYPEVAVSTKSSDSYTFNLGRYGSSIVLPSSVVGEKTYEIKFDSTGFTGVAYEYGDSEKQPTRITDTDVYTAPGTLNLEFDGTYEPLETGYIAQDFYIKVVARHNTINCKSIEFTITSESGVQNYYGVQATSSDGNYYTFDIIPGELEARFPASSFADYQIGYSWCYRFQGNYTPATVTSGGTFVGLEDDTYVISCVDGGTIGGTNNPKVTIRLISGAEFIGPITLASNKVTTAFGTEFTFSQDGQMALGETWLCRVESEQNGRISSIILADSLPEALRTYDAEEDEEIQPVYLNVKFCVKRDIELPNIKPDDIYVTIPWNLKVTQDDMLETSGALKALPLLDGKIKVAYREWVADKANKFNYISSVDDLDTIPGPLTPENPLKYGVYKALANANGELLVYTASLGETLDAWSDAINVGANSREVYTVVPMTQDIEIQNYVVALINSDSGEETCSWKNCFLNTKAPTEILRAGRETSLDGNSILATVSREGLVEIASRLSNGKANVDLKTVVPGDELRVLQGEDSYATYTIDRIVGDTIYVLNPYKRAVEAKSGIEIWHTFTKEEQVEYISGIAQSFANRRVVLVWPDEVGVGTQVVPGYFLCAALAGLCAGSLPNQGLTRVSLTGFDDLTKSSEYFTDTQLNQLAGSGVWIVTEDKDGTVFTRHAITTSTVDIQEREEMFTRILDYIAFQLHDILDSYIGTTNVTNEALEDIYERMKIFMNGITATNYNAMGPLATAYNIVSVEQDDLLQDRVNVVVQVTIVKAINNIVLRIQAG